MKAHKRHLANKNHFQEGYKKLFISFLQNFK